MARRFAWYDALAKNKYTAGGILFYDDHGVYLISERNSKNYNVLEYTDVGGRYEPQDGCIWATIRRELYEETYGTIDCTVAYIKNLASDTRVKRAYVTNHDGIVCYVCLCVPLYLAPEIMRTENLMETFKNNKATFHAENPTVTGKFYETVTFEKIAHNKITMFNISYRMTSILKQL